MLTCGLVSVLVGTQGGARVCSLSYQVLCIHLHQMELSPCHFTTTCSHEHALQPSKFLLFGERPVWKLRFFEQLCADRVFMWSDRKLCRSWNCGVWSHHHVCFHRHQSSCLDCTWCTFSESLSDKLGQTNIWCTPLYYTTPFGINDIVSSRYRCYLSTCRLCMCSLYQFRFIVRI